MTVTWFCSVSSLPHGATAEVLLLRRHAFILNWACYLRCAQTSREKFHDCDLYLKSVTYNAMRTAGHEQRVTTAVSLLRTPVAF